MGGPGSGRRPAWLDESPRKETTEDYFPLDVREVRRHGLIGPDQQELPGVARIVWIPAGFGLPRALRPWFLCPRDECGTRVAILYGRSPETDAPSWACRTCRDLCYPVELEDRAERAARKMHKRRDRLGPGAQKPKRMRHETYVRLGVEYLEAVKEFNEAHRERTAHFLEQMEKERIRFDL
jgi:hypothetical protein